MSQHATPVPMTSTALRPAVAAWPRCRGQVGLAPFPDLRRCVWGKPTISGLLEGD